MSELTDYAGRRLELGDLFRAALHIAPRAAHLVRVLHAELERIANHVDTAMRLADAAALAVATARLALHKERVLWLVSRMRGSWFGRGVVIPAASARSRGNVQTRSSMRPPGCSGRSPATPAR